MKLMERRGMKTYKFKQEIIVQAKGKNEAKKHIEAMIWRTLKHPDGVLLEEIEEIK